MHEAAQLRQRTRLAEGLPAGKRYAAQQRVSCEPAEQLFHRHDRAALKRMRLRVVAARAVVRAALHKHGEAKAGAVDDRVVHNPGNAQRVRGKLFPRGLCVLHRAPPLRGRVSRGHALPRASRC